MINGGIHVCQKIYWLHFLLILQKKLMISVCMLWLKNKCNCCIPENMICVVCTVYRDKGRPNRVKLKVVKIQNSSMSNMWHIFMKYM